jgi:hypothetical protein
MGVVFTLTFFPEYLRGFALFMNEEIPWGENEPWVYR